MEDVILKTYKNVFDKNFFQNLIESISTKKLTLYIMWVLLHLIIWIDHGMVFLNGYSVSERIDDFIQKYFGETHLVLQIITYRYNVIEFLIFLLIPIIAYIIYFFVYSLVDKMNISIISKGKNDANPS